MHGQADGEFVYPSRAEQEATMKLFGKRPGDPAHATPRCSFCGRDVDAVAKLIAGPGVFICDACVDRCNEMLGRDATVRDR